MPIDTSRKLLKPGSIYLIKCGHLYKIGCSDNPRRRLYQIRWEHVYFLAEQGLVGQPIDIIHTIPTNNMRIAERVLHLKYASHRVGMMEWFALADDQVAWLKGLDEVNVEDMPIEVTRGPSGRMRLNV
jgi:hypothetical protein